MRKDDLKGGKQDEEGDRGDVSRDRERRIVLVERRCECKFNFSFRAKEATPMKAEEGVGLPTLLDEAVEEERGWDDGSGTKPPLRSDKRSLQALFDSRVPESPENPGASNAAGLIGNEDRVEGARSYSKSRLSRSLSSWPKQKMASPTAGFEYPKPLKGLRWLPPGKLRSEMFYVARALSSASSPRSQPLSLLDPRSLAHGHGARIETESGERRDAGKKLPPSRENPLETVRGESDVGQSRRSQNFPRNSNDAQQAPFWFQISWIRKRDLHILTSSIFAYTGDGRFSVKHPEASDEWSLLINYVQQRDAGVYECQVNTEPKMNLAFVLTVEAAEAKILGPEDVYVKKGSTISLTCTVNVPSTPPSIVFWHHGGALVDFDSPRGGISLETEKTESGTTSKLLVTQARLTDSGNYTCISSNANPASVMVHVLNDLSTNRHRRTFSPEALPGLQCPAKVESEHAFARRSWRIRGKFLVAVNLFSRYNGAPRVVAWKRATVRLTLWKSWNTVADVHPPALPDVEDVSSPLYAVIVRQIPRQWMSLYRGMQLEWRRRGTAPGGARRKRDGVFIHQASKSLVINVAWKRATVRLTLWKSWNTVADVHPPALPDVEDVSSPLYAVIVRQIPRQWMSLYRGMQLEWRRRGTAPGGEHPAAMQHGGSRGVTPTILLATFTLAISNLLRYHGDQGCSVVKCERRERILLEEAYADHGVGKDVARSKWQRDWPSYREIIGVRTAPPVSVVEAAVLVVVPPVVTVSGPEPCHPGSTPPCSTPAHSEYHSTGARVTGLCKTTGKLFA
ncbi:hypothetical protein WN48_01152 [Eufriesea mexicana]|nr:hypothetical protein WN48_01152 [Eufriesea mexicana]